MIKGFRDFIMRGNVIDLAVAVIIGAAFTVIVTSFVTNVLTPLIASLVGKPDFSALILYINGGKINYGIFLNSVISFLLHSPVRQQRHRRREGADVVTPAAIGPQFFRECAEVINAAADGPPDRVKMAEIMRRHGLTPAPPPPQT
jgi:Large-conductance mechanosensitive channel, MscL